MQVEPLWKEVTAAAAQTCSATVSNAAWAAAVATYKVDVTNPTAAVTSTGAFNAAGWGGSLTGTATDESGGSGIDVTAGETQLTIHDDTANKYWTGAGWSAVAAPATWLNPTTGPTAVAPGSNATWSYTFATANFTNAHTYTIQTVTGDYAGNNSATASATVIYDTSAPTNAGLTTNGVYNGAGWPGAVGGTTNDSGAGSNGISAVNVSIQKDGGANACWSGATFTAACPSWVAVTSGATASGAADANWSYTLASAALTNGSTYSVSVQSSDGVTNANQSGTLAAGSFVYDSAAPSTAALTTNGTYNSGGWSGSVAGTVNDSATGSHGISAVDVSIQDSVSGKCWNGTNFTTAACANWVAVTSGGSSAGASNANWSYSLASGNLTDGHSYSVSIRATDATTSGNQSGALALGSFNYDTSAATMTSATVAANGTTVTVTWSENLDQTMAVPGSAFSVAPNGGAGIAGTAAAISYPAANQTQLTLSSAVHHLDSLAITYTKSGSNPMIRDLALATGNAGVTATLNNASITNNTSNTTPSTPALVSPADASQLSTTTPTLTATFSDPDTQDTGKVTFEVCTTSNCSSSLGTFDSSSTTIAVGANGSAAVPGGLGLTSGTTYYWRAKNVDSSAAGSANSATRSFTVDTTAPTMSSATVAANGTTVTITWSENLDQTQNVPGSAFSIAPNGGAGIAGTAAAVSYPAANQTQLTLSTAVHHLDSLALTYTKPGSNPMIRDTALATGNPAATATLNNASITNSTSNATPNTPALGAPADETRLNTATPTLNATFDDPDTQDTGKITFEVCSTSNCSSSLGTFDSSSTSLAVGQSGSASVPGGFSLASGTTYYWRAKNVDSAAGVSAYSAMRSFLVDTAAPTMSSATVDGTSVTITWSENLDQTQAVPGSAFSIAPNGGASIAGTATAVSYPAANQTQLTLSTTVHHLDSLAITYTKPGSNPMIRDLALATGNAGVTATLDNGSITNSTADVAPNPPALVTPVDALRVNSTTPTLTATFDDPDTQDTAKITF
jgi:uncharacterized repeat protein (TIGR02059 family)